MSKISQEESGFTLIELSIVLAIIAVIAGGVFAGQSLMDAAKIRSVVADVSKYRTAVESFRQQYNAYPGDISNAFSFFGSDCGTDAAAPTGCNGDGDGSIEGLEEGYRAWQHLALAGNIDSSFTGVVGSGCAPGINVPSSSLGLSAGFGFEKNTSTQYVTNRPSFVSLLFVGANASNLCTGAALTTNEAYEVDLKIDDGNPTIGEAVATGASCISGNDFDYAQAGAVCAVAFTLN